MNKIFCIKMGSSENRKKICQKYLSPESKKPGIMLGFNEADEESINKAIDAELALESNACDEEKIKCWKDVDESIMQCVNKTNGEIKPMAVTRARNVIREVCMADESDIFFTFYDGFLWWCKPLGGPGEEIEFCKEMVVENNIEGRRKSDLIRKTSKWKKTSIDGKRTLNEWRICGQLRRKQMVQSTMYQLKDESDIKLFKWTIGSDVCKELGEFDENLEKIKEQFCKAIGLLSPTDFEAFVDMVFTQSGLKRVGRSGSNVKAIDGEYQFPFNSKNLISKGISEISGKTIYVQDKAKLNKKGLKDAVESLYELLSDMENTIIIIAFHTWENNKMEIHDALDKIEDSDLKNWAKEKIQFCECKDLVDMWLAATGIPWLRKTAYAAIQ